MLLTSTVIDVYKIKSSSLTTMYLCSLSRVVCCGVIAVLVALVASSPTKGWSGRSLSLLDP